MVVASGMSGSAEASLTAKVEAALKSEVGTIALALLTAFGAALLSVRLCRFFGRW